MTTASTDRRPTHSVDVAAVLGDYAAHLATVSAQVNPAELRTARQLCARFGGPPGFAAAPLAEQLAVPRTTRRFLDWLIGTGRLRPTADYLVARRFQLGQLLARVHPAFHQRFLAAASELGFAG